jgi:Zn-dependent protease
MFIGEPPPTQADIHFRLLGIPVRVHPFFWVAILLLGVAGKARPDPIEVVIWVGVVFVSILVHELGHAFLQRYYGGRPWITLYGFGGLASCNDCDRSPRSQILISLAGPAAGFLLTALIVAAVRLSGRWIAIALASNVLTLDESGIHWRRLPEFVLYGADFAAFASHPLDIAVRYALFVNVLWGVINLLPIYPLDGGQISRELFTLGNPRRGIIQSLQLSIGVAIIVAAYGLLVARDLYLGLVFLLLAYGSYQSLYWYRNH